MQRDYHQQQFLLSAVPSDNKPNGNVMALLGLGSLFAGWYLANIYFNM